MSVIQKIFAYNTGSLISGTTQVGDIAVSDASVEYSNNYGGLQWWGGPDETNGYVIAHTDPSGSHDGGAGGNAYLGFWRSSGLTDNAFLNLCNSIPPRIGDTPFTNTTDASVWLYDNGYWTSFSSSGAPSNDFVYITIPNGNLNSEIIVNFPPFPVTPTPTASPVVTTPTPTPSVTATLTPTVTTTSTGTPTPTPTSASTASFAVSMVESGGNVVLSYSGILDLTGLNLAQNTTSGSGGVGPAQGAFGIGPTGALNISLYTGATFSYPSNFGTGGGGPSSVEGTGDYFGVFSSILPTNCVVVPSGYTSGNYIQGTTTLSASTFSSLGMNTGIYNYSWGAGAGQSFVLTIGGVGVTPTPTATSVTPTPTPTSGASGNFNVTVSQQGPDVVWNGSGSFNLTALSSAGSGTIGAGFSAGNAAWAIGPNVTIDQYSGVTTYPTSFGTGGVGVTTTTGSTFGVLPGASTRILYVPAGYTSNTTISGTATYANNTISGMGLTPGTYTWSWGTGGNTSTLVMTISS